MIRSRSVLRISILLSVFCLAAGSLTRAVAEDGALTPRLLETDNFLAQQAADAKAAGEPEWLPDARKQVEGFALKQKISVLPGARTYNLEKPPLKHYWWNYPIYAVIGFPRDLIDGFMGFTAIIPLINFGTGAVYEVAPTQVLMRNWRDWHTWPFYAKLNKNGHGWLDGSWGFFSNKHYMKLSAVNDVKLARWKAHNQVISEQLETENKKIGQSNEEAQARRDAFLRETRVLFDAGKHRAVIERLVPYREIDPLNRPARAMLAVSLLDDLDKIPERAWADKLLTDLLLSSSREVLIPVKDEIQNTTGTMQTKEDINRYRAAIDMRLGDYNEALSAMRNLVAENPANVTYLRLQVETALATKDPQAIEDSIHQLEKAAGTESVAGLNARGRQALLNQQPDQAIGIYKRLVQIEPSNPRFDYLLGMSYVQQAQKGGDYQKKQALKSLEKAADLARTTEEKDFYLQTREAAAKLNAK